MKRKNLLLTACALAASLTLFGCRDAHDHDHGDHAGHDHGEHAAPAPAAPGTNTVATTGDAKPYPLDKCIVSDEKLGSMGGPIVITHEGQEIKFCCESCQPKFEKDPAKYLTKLAPVAK
jgi:hypothetical protein